MRQHTCCFTGHRNVPKACRLALNAHLVEELNALIDKGVVNFISGGALGFDQIAALAVLKLREGNPEIRLSFALPCRDQARVWSGEQRVFYERLKAAADEVHYVSELYYDGCMKRRNQYMVDNSAYCICALKDHGTGTGQTVRMARANGLDVINVWPGLGSPS